MTVYAGRYSEDLQDRFGNGFRNAKVAVQTLVGGAVTLYADRSKTAYVPASGLAANEIKADAKGNLQFFAEPGNYQIGVTPVGGSLLPAFPVSVLPDPLEPVDTAALDAEITLAVQQEAVLTLARRAEYVIDARWSGLLTFSDASEVDQSIRNLAPLGVDRDVVAHASLSKRPTKQSVNGLPVFRTDGVDDQPQTAPLSPALAQPVTHIWVGRYLSGRFVVDSPSATQRHSLDIVSGMWRISAGTPFVELGPAVSGAWAIIAAVVNGTETHGWVGGGIPGVDASKNLLWPWSGAAYGGNWGGNQAVLGSADVLAHWVFSGILSRTDIDLLGSYYAAVIAQAGGVVEWTRPFAPGELVVDFGPDGNGVEDFGPLGTAEETRIAFQAANDFLAESGGGTILTDPAATYVFQGVLQDSDVTFDFGESHLEHPTGTGSTSMVTGRTFTPNGTISVGTTQLTVSSAVGFAVGARVAIRAAGGPSPSQFVQLAAGIDSDDTTIPLTSAHGFASTGTGAIIGNEVVSWTGLAGNSLTGCLRGLYGSVAASHSAGENVALAVRFYSTIAAINGLVITLEDEALFSVTSAEVHCGVLRPKVLGGHWDLKRQSTSQENHYAVRWPVTRYGEIALNTSVASGHGTISIRQGSTDFTIVGGEYTDQGGLISGGGSAIWIFHGCKNGSIQHPVIRGDGWHGVTLDDRTVNATEWDAPLENVNVIDPDIVLDSIDASNSGVNLNASNNCSILGGSISGCRFAVHITDGAQAPVPLPSAGCIVDGINMSEVEHGLYVDTAGVNYVGTLIEGTNVENLVTDVQGTLEDLP